MRTRKLRSLNVVLLVSIGLQPAFCRPDESETIVVEKAGNRLGAATLKVSSEDRVTVRWSRGKSAVAFKIEFLHENPCDPKSSRLDANPAICVLPSGNGHERAYAYRIVSQDKSHARSSPPVTLARVKTCDGCRKPPRH